mgnify:CR=1 FL=1
MIRTGGFLGPGVGIGPLFGEMEEPDKRKKYTTDEYTSSFVDFYNFGGIDVSVPDPDDDDDDDRQQPAVNVDPTKAVGSEDQGSNIFNAVNITTGGPAFTSLDIDPNKFIQDFNMPTVEAKSDSSQGGFEDFLEKAKTTMDKSGGIPGVVATVATGLPITGLAYAVGEMNRKAQLGTAEAIVAAGQSIEQGTGKVRTPGDLVRFQGQVMHRKPGSRVVNGNLMGLSQDQAYRFMEIKNGFIPGTMKETQRPSGYESEAFGSYDISGKEGIVIVPVAYQREFLRWAPRGQGSGAPTVYKTQAECPETKRSTEDNKDYCTDGSGDYIEETHQHFVLVIGEDGKGETALIPMKSTQLKKSRKFNSMIMAQCDRDGFARFAYKFRFKTLAEQNDKGSWHGWEMQLEGPLLDEETQKKDPAQFARNLATYEQAKSFSESVQAGNVEVKRENDDVKSGEKDQIPF